MHPTIIEINKKIFENNLIQIRQQIGVGVRLLLPVKANAYGHGLVLIAKLAEPLVDYFGVACLDEGISLRQNGITKPILVFGAIDEEQIRGLVENNLEITISSMYKAKLVHDFCLKYSKKCKVQIKVDTGMNRVGIRPESFNPLLEFVLASNVLMLTGVYSHLAMSEVPDKSVTNAQITSFNLIAETVKARKPSVICHLANSGGVCYHLSSHFDMVRPGLLSYGYFPGEKLNTGNLVTISPCFSLKSRVSYFKVVNKGAGISYNHRYHTSEMTRVVTIPIGYGDGYRRGLSNSGEVLIRDKRYRISGTICMDMFMVDIGRNGEAYVGDEVVLIGRQGNEELKIEELARKLDTIIYEVLVGFNERIPRVIV